MTLSSSSDCEKARLSTESEDASLLEGRDEYPSQWHRRYRAALPLLNNRAAWILHGCFILLYSLIALLLISRNSRSELVPTPANSAIEYERRTFFPVTYDNPFTGDPRPEFDAAWHDLLQYAHVRVSKEELEAANYTSLIFQDGSGYVAQLASTHQLHCLKQIRHYLHHEHYFPDATPDELKAQSMHVDHCLEVLRLSTMCAGDVSLTPFYFAKTEEGLYYPFVKTRTYHQCADWERIQDWAKSRAVDLFDPKLLELPRGATLLRQPVPSMVL